MWVPFPFVEHPRFRHRPALIISREWLANRFRLYWSVMITSAANTGWADDISLVDRFAECGLPAPSVIRPVKVTTISATTAVRMGKLPPDLLSKAQSAVRSQLGLNAAQ